MTSEPSPLTVLLCAEAVTVTHLARPAVLARALAAAGHRPVLACPQRWEPVWADLPAQRVPLASLAAAEFLRRLAAGSPVYRSDELERMVAEDLALFARLRPDVVVGDFRISLGVSARLARIPYVNLVNAYWHPAAQVTPWPVPENPLVRLAGAGLAGGVFSVIQPWIRRLHARPLDAVRRRHGLAPLRDVRAAYADSDLCLLPDPPGLVTLGDGGPAHAAIGHLAWAPPISGLPAWWDRLPPGRSCIYVCFGSSGAVERLEAVVDGAARCGLPVVVATAGRAALAPRPGVWVADWLPGDLVAGRARVVVCNGGSPSAYQALAAGAPVLGIPANLDQYLAMDAVAAAGLGRRLRAGQAGAEAVAAAVTALASDELMAGRVAAAAARMAAHDVHATAVAAIERLHGSASGVRQVG
jgi:UDP:flavonoid glycosyltransferase YjiC (YdhE family)